MFCFLSRGRYFTFIVGGADFFGLAVVGLIAGMILRMSVDVGGCMIG